MKPHVFLFFTWVALFYFASGEITRYLNVSESAAVGTFLGYFNDSRTSSTNEQPNYFIVYPNDDGAEKVGANMIDLVPVLPKTTLNSVPILFRSPPSKFSFLHN